MLKPRSSSLLRISTVAALLVAAVITRAQNAVNVTFGGRTFTNQGLTGVGRMPAAMRDSFGETFGSFSAFTFDALTWTRNGSGFTGTLYAQPDRGYNAAGTTDYAPRFNILSVTFAPAPGGAATQNQVGLTLIQTIPYKEANGTPFTALDPTATGSGSRTGFPALPVAYNGKISLDGEGIVRLPDGSLYVSDEYGPYLYRFSGNGTLLAAIRPPEALIPKRNGADSFASNNPGAGQPAPVPGDPATGRQNNQGLEGLTLTPDGRYLAALLQSATRQDGGTGGSSATRNNSRLLLYNLTTGLNAPTLAGEYVIQLPGYPQGSSTRIAAQSEMLALNNTQFLVLARDGNGRGVATATSVYRKILLYDIAAATNIAGSAFDTAGTPVAPGGVLTATVTPATRAEFIDINDGAQLAKFGLHNGPTDDMNNLSEKWEGLALVPALDSAAPNDAYLFVGNDNDFTTTDGFQVGGAYNAGLENDSLILVYRVTLPTYVDRVAYTAMVQTGAPLFQSLRLSLTEATRGAARDLGGHLTRLRLGQQATTALSAFATGDWQSASHDAGPGFSGDKADSWSASGGIEYTADGLSLGVGAAKSNITADLPGGIGRHETEGKGGGGFISYSRPSYYVELGLFRQRLDVATIRQTGAYQLTATGQTTGTARTWRAITGLRGSLAGVQWTVEAGREGVHTRLDPFAETGAIQAGIESPVQRISSNLWQGTMQLSRDFPSGNLTFTPYVRARYEHELDDQIDPLTLALVGRSTVSGGTYEVPAWALDHGLVRGTAGITATMGTGLWLNVEFAKALSDDRGDASAWSISLRHSF